MLIIKIVHSLTTRIYNIGIKKPYFKDYCGLREGRAKNAEFSEISDFFSFQWISAGSRMLGSLPVSPTGWKLYPSPHCFGFGSGPTASLRTHQFSFQNQEAKILSHCLSIGIVCMAAVQSLRSKQNMHELNHNWRKVALVSLYYRNYEIQ